MLNKTDKRYTTLAKLLMTTNKGKEIAAYTGVSMYLMATVPGLTTPTIKDGTLKVPKLLMRNLAWDINDCGVINVDLFVDILTRHYRVKHSMFTSKLPIDSDDDNSMVPDLFGIRDHLGSYLEHINNNMSYLVETFNTIALMAPTINKEGGEH